MKPICVRVCDVPGKDSSIEKNMMREGRKVPRPWSRAGQGLGCASSTPPLTWPPGADSEEGTAIPTFIKSKVVSLNLSKIQKAHSKSV